MATLKELLSASPETKAAAALNAVLVKHESAYKMAVAETQAKIAELSENLDAAKVSGNPQSAVSLISDIQDFERGLKILEELQQELFPANL